MDLNFSSPVYITDNSREFFLTSYFGREKADEIGTPALNSFLPEADGISSRYNLLTLLMIHLILNDGIFEDQHGKTYYKVTKDLIKYFGKELKSLSFSGVDLYKLKGNQLQKIVRAMVVPEDTYVYYQRLVLEYNSDPIHGMAPILKANLNHYQLFGANL